MNTELKYLVSNYDIARRVKDCKIIIYSELKDYNDIIELIPNDNSSLFILIKTSLNSGHWSVLSRNNKNLLYFDSYGVIYDGEFTNIDTKERILLHENKFYLTKLLKKAMNNNFNITYNNYQFQQYSSEINTCGKWVIMFSNFILNSDIKTIEIFKERILNFQKQNKIKKLDYIPCIFYK